MKTQEHWILSKLIVIAICQIIAMGVCIIVACFYSPQSETLLQVSKERLFIYSFIYGVSFLISGEIIGLFASSHRNLSWKKFVLSLIAAFVGTLGLILIVWVFEFEFVGRFAVLKIILLTGVITFLIISLLEKLSLKNPWRILALLPNEEGRRVQVSFKFLEDEIKWLPAFHSSSNSNLVNYCSDQGVDLVILNKADTKLDVIGLLASGVRVLSVSAFWEMFTQKIPHSEINQDWLTKLDLRQRDPLARRVKRLSDIIIASIGLVIAFPILLIACVAIVLESGFPVFFQQTRSGYLGRPYVLYKLRTMKQDAEKNGAEWAMKFDSRVTWVGKFLRKTRIDEIPQFWNVIKGEMSIVGPRPERPELEGKIIQELPFWSCRYLLKPGLTGWAQIKYQYASDLDTSEEKLAYDFFYVKNASFFLDLEIMLSTLRSLMKGSR